MSSLIRRGWGQFHFPWIWAGLESVLINRKRWKCLCVNMEPQLPKAQMLSLTVFQHYHMSKPGLTCWRKRCSQRKPGPQPPASQPANLGDSTACHPCKSEPSTESQNHPTEAFNWGVLDPRIWVEWLQIIETAWSELYHPFLQMKVLFNYCIITQDNNR